MDSWTAASVLHNQLICFPSVGVTSSAINPKCSPSFHKVYESHSRQNFGLFAVENRYKIWASGVTKLSRALSYLQTQQGTWEEPDDGSGSEYDTDDEEDDSQVEEDNYDFESDWKEVEKTKTSAINGFDNTLGKKYEENIVKEVEQLLEPEERAILEQNVTPNLEKISTEKWSLLHTLSLSTQISCMDKLLENGFDINFANKEGLTALHMAIIGKKEAVTSHLLRKGASPHVKDKDGATPLHYAVQVGAKQTVKLLIKYKVDVNVADNEGWTPLHIAIQSRNRDIAKILLGNGADKTRKNKDGKTALDLSLCYGKDFKSYDLARLLKVVPADRDF